MCQFDLCIRICYTADNANTRFASEMSKLELMDSFCLPLLSYGCEVLYFSTQQLRQLNAYDESVGVSESVKQLMHGFVSDWILNTYPLLLK